MKLKFWFKILLSIIPIGLFGLFIAVIAVRSLFLTDVISVPLMFFCQIVLFVEIILLSARALKYGKSREQSILYIVLMIFLWPFVIIYIWWIDNKLVNNYNRGQASLHQ